MIYIKKCVDKEVNISSDYLKDKKSTQNEIDQLLNVIFEKKYIPSTSLQVENVNNLVVTEKGSNLKVNDFKKIIFINKELKCSPFKIKRKKASIMEKSEVEKLEEELIKEKEKNLLKQKIINMVNDFIKKSEKSINELQEQLKSINNNYQNKVTVQDISNIETDFKTTLDQILIIKKQYFIINENKDFLQFNQLNNDIMQDQISDYKFRVGSNKKICDLAYSCKENLDDISSIFSLCLDADNIKNKINNQKEEITKRDKEFKQYKNSLNQIKNIHAKIEKNIQLQNIMLENLKKQITDFQNLNSKSNMFYNNILLMATLMTGISTLNSTLLISSIFLNKALNIKNNQISLDKTKYDSFEIFLNYQLNELNYMSVLVDSTLQKINNLKHEFEIKFDEYRKEIKEYDEIYNKIISAEVMLKDKGEEIELLKKEKTKIR